jgi:hypothetical protein
MFVVHENYFALPVRATFVIHFLVSQIFNRLSLLLHHTHTMLRSVVSTCYGPSQPARLPPCSDVVVYVLLIYPP